MSFEEWYQNNAEYTPKPGCGFVGWTDEKLEEAFNAGKQEGVSRWISVEDRLPDDNTSVLTNRGENRNRKISFFRDGFFRSATIIDRNVTHWMLLPEPPEIK